MNYLIRYKQSSKTKIGPITLPASKSEANRALIINALSTEPAVINNLSNARDTQTMKSLLKDYEIQAEFDVLDAGTVMRFLTAFLAVKAKEPVVITGSKRMQERPIGLLTKALERLGVKIEYLKQSGYPPLKIYPLNEQQSNFLEIKGNVSSQFISALLMIAPALPKGLQLNILPPVYSYPYIQLTTDLMQLSGIDIDQSSPNSFSIAPQAYKTVEQRIESDWSAASYWYSIIALSEIGTTVMLKGLKRKSSQGDHTIRHIMKSAGIQTSFDEAGARLKKISEPEIQEQNLDFSDCPDLAQTILSCFAALGINLKITGLESLKIKETNRVDAMVKELGKFDVQLKEIDEHYWEMDASKFKFEEQKEIETYDDHRMAMCFAPYSLLGSIVIKNTRVVEKSYPDFWEHLKLTGVEISSQA